MFVETPSFCWTKYGTESGESVDSIFSRKQRELADTDGIFLWGIGNSLSRSINALISDGNTPRVLFSPMKSRPASHDVSPSRIVEWVSGVGLDGKSFSVPSTCRVLSKMTSRKKKHFAFVCKAESSELFQKDLFLDLSVYTNYVSGAPVGSSQISSVLRRSESLASGLIYPVMASAELVYPYFVTLDHWADVA